MNEKDKAAPAYQPLLPAESRRNPVDTFLTYPEWSIVHAYEDLAGVTRQKGEEHFGYWQSTSGYWSSLCDLSQLASKRGDISLEMKAMLYIIGISFSGEMAVKGLYETTVGRLTAWLRGPERTPEDNFAIKTAEKYAAFLRQTPWYEFPFWQTVKDLWSNTEPGNPSLVRRTERHVALTLEYGVKAIYAKAMGLLAGAAPAKLTIESIINGLGRQQLETDKVVTVRRSIPEGMVVETPRYRAFTEFLQRLAAADGNVLEIAGNDRIFVTVVGEAKQRDPAGLIFRSPAGSASGIDRLARASIMFAVPVQAVPGQERLGIELEVRDLTAFMRAAPSLGLTFEHAYDY
ncbi:MAG: hypothetical protein IOC94_02320 [Methylocystis sp.]|nr:hypothetical protein [Methylocystis sp.]